MDPTTLAKHTNHLVCFNADAGITDGFGLNVFYQQDGRIYRTCFTSGCGVETFGTPWTLLDLTPLGRQEAWEGSPPGYLSRPLTAGGDCTMSTSKSA